MALLIRSTSYYGHVILTQTKAQSVIFLFIQPLQQSASFTRPDFCVLSGDCISGFALHFLK